MSPMDAGEVCIIHFQWEAAGVHGEGAVRMVGDWAGLIFRRYLSGESWLVSCAAACQAASASNRPAAQPQNDLFCIMNKIM